MGPAYGLSLQTLCAFCTVWSRQAVTLSLIQQIYNERYNTPDEALRSGSYSDTQRAVYKISAYQIR